MERQIPWRRCDAVIPCIRMIAEGTGVLIAPTQLWSLGWPVYNHHRFFSYTMITLYKLNHIVFFRIRESKFAKAASIEWAWTNRRQRICFAEFSSATAKGVIFFAGIHDVGELKKEDVKANALIAVSAGEVYPVKLRNVELRNGDRVVVHPQPQPSRKRTIQVQPNVTQATRVFQIGRYNFNGFRSNCRVAVSFGFP